MIPFPDKNFDDRIACIFIYLMRKFLDLNLIEPIKISSSPKPALFLDRDGVIIKEKHYISDPEKVELEFYVKEFIRHFKSLDWYVIVITNQSGISRGYLDWKSYEEITQRMLSLLGSSSSPHAIYATSSLNDDNDSWRKPNPGMIIQSCCDFNIDKSRSCIIGDKLSDLEAGFNAKLRDLILLKTGHGNGESLKVKAVINDANMKFVQMMLEFQLI